MAAIQFNQITLSSWWTQPIWNICSSIWIISPGIGVKTKHVWRNHHLVNIVLFLPLYWIVFCVLRLDQHLSLNLHGLARRLSRNAASNLGWVFSWPYKVGPQKTSYKYGSYKRPRITGIVKKGLLGVIKLITPRSGVVTPLITCRGRPPCRNQSSHILRSWFGVSKITSFRGEFLHNRKGIEIHFQMVDVPFLCLFSWG